MAAWQFALLSVVKRCFFFSGVETGDRRPETGGGEETGLGRDEEGKGKEAGAHLFFFCTLDTLCTLPCIAAQIVHKVRSIVHHKSQQFARCCTVLY